MSDEADLAGDRLEKELEARRAEVQRMAALQAGRPLPTSCINGCGEKPRERSRYCSSECREDHAERVELDRRRGIR